jgi:phosphoribosyl 1,2-cyclic phosphodiesterase
MSTTPLLVFLTFMSLFITSLNSGSNGNCYYVGNSEGAVLIDAGISCRETERRMGRLGLDMRTVKAIFISHEHIDHITGVQVLSKKYQLPVYITNHTLQESNVSLADYLVKSFDAEKPVNIGSLSVTPFKKYHDACDPHSFIVSDGTVNIGVFTDIGIACPQVVRYFRKCHAVFLESNYCPDMLRTGSYPYHLKQRISSNTGHLSNAQALELFTRYRTNRLTHLVLSHLSANNNNPELVNDLFSKEAGEVTIVVASRKVETPVYCIDAVNDSMDDSFDDIDLTVFMPAPAPRQLSLF